MAIIVLLVVFNNLASKSRWDIIAFYLVLALIVWIFGFYHQISYTIRSYIFLVIVYILGTIDLALFGIAEDWRLYFFAFTILITVFLGWKVGLVALFVSTFTFVIVAWQIATRNLVITASLST